jgi:hypothetical protein
MEGLKHLLGRGDSPTFELLHKDLFGNGTKWIVCSVGVEQWRAFLDELSRDDDGPARHSETHAAEKLSDDWVRSGNGHK